MTTLLRRFLPFPLSSLLFLVSIFYLNITARVLLAPVLPLIERDLRLGHGQAGSLFFVLQLGYSAGLLGSGFVSSRLNHRRTIALSTMMVGIALLVLWRSSSLPGMRGGLVLLGVSAGLYLPSGIVTVTEQVPREHWGKALSLHELAPNLGFIAAPLLVEALLPFVSWQGIFAILGLLAMLTGLLFILFGRGGSHKPALPRSSTVKQIVRDPSFWVMAALFTVTVGASMGLYTLMPLFLLTEIGLDREIANTITGFSRVPGILLLFFSGLIIDRIGERRSLALSLATIGSLTILVGAIRGPVITTLLVFLQSASIVCFFPAGFSMISRIFSPGLRSLAVSMVTVVGSLFGSGVIPAALGHWSEAFSFSSGFLLLGVLTSGMLPLLLYRGSRARIEAAPDPAQRP